VSERMPPTGLDEVTPVWEVDQGWMTGLSALLNSLCWIGVDGDQIVVKYDSDDHDQDTEALRVVPGLLRVKELPKPWMRRYGFTLAAESKSLHLSFLPPAGQGRIRYNGCVTRSSLDEFSYGSLRVALLFYRLRLAALPGPTPPFTIASRLASYPARAESQGLASVNAQRWRDRLSSREPSLRHV
jgi:hypothetical protein